VGAPDWDYVTAYRGDLASTLAGLHAEVFDRDGSYFVGRAAIRFADRRVLLLALLRPPRRDLWSST